LSCRLLFSTFPHISKQDFLTALAEMKRGGPDVPGCYAEFNNVKLGHNRLSILDLNARSNQPFKSVDGRYLIIYNGEVYNFKELAREYKLSTRTNSDTEVVLELSIKLGFENALQKFNGMFTYVIYDTLSGEFFVARDRLGIKPLYMYSDGRHYYFSSEVNAIVKLLEGKVEFDPFGIRQYKRLRDFYNRRTIYKNIEMFPAGHYMKCGIMHRWWQLCLGQQEPPSDEELRQLVESAVDYRMISDVSLGANLSGGLDSTIVAALVAKRVESPLHTWIAGITEDRQFNEFSYGKIAASAIGSIHHEVSIDAQRFLRIAAGMIRHRKEPLSVPNEVLLYEMARETKVYNTVVLCGEGADELFFGYDRVLSWAAQQNSFDIYEFSQVFGYGASYNDVEVVEDALIPFIEYGPKPVDIVAAFFQTARLHGLLRRLDNSTMMNAVETRVPFCDFRLVERLYGVRFDWKIDNKIVKAPLKRVFSDLVPSEIIKRPKIGFTVPLETIFSVEKDIAFDQWTEFNIKCLREAI
jgi:asparagine synthase (glutamine-hydrolysing)